VARQRARNLKNWNPQQKHSGRLAYLGALLQSTALVLNLTGEKVAALALLHGAANKQCPSFVFL
jgi:hypothetical protein